MKKHKEEKEREARQAHLLENFMEDDEDKQKEIQNDYYQRDKRKSVFDLAEQNIHTDSDTAAIHNIVKKSKKSIVQSLLNSMDQ